MRPNACAICHQPTELEYDGETGQSYYGTYCSLRCQQVSSERPYCFNGDCPRQVCGTMTHVTNGRAVGKGAKAVYECPRCKFTGTALHWAVSASYHHGRVDAVQHQYLIPARSENARKQLTYDHPLSRAHGRAYLLGLAHAGR